MIYIKKYEDIIMRAKFVNEAIKHLTPRSEEEIKELRENAVKEYMEYLDNNPDVENLNIDGNTITFSIKDMGQDFTIEINSSFVTVEIEDEDGDYNDSLECKHPILSAQDLKEAIDEISGYIDISDKFYWWRWTMIPGQNEDEEEFFENEENDN